MIINNFYSSEREAGGMMGLKRLWRRDGVRYFLFSFVLALIFLALKRPSGF